MRALVFWRDSRLVPKNTIPNSYDAAPGTIPSFTAIYNNLQNTSSQNVV